MFFFVSHCMIATTAQKNNQRSLRIFALRPLYVAGKVVRALLFRFEKFPLKWSDRFVLNVQFELYSSPCTPPIRIISVPSPSHPFPLPFRGKKEYEENFPIVSKRLRCAASNGLDGRVAPFDVGLSGSIFDKVTNSSDPLGCWLTLKKSWAARVDEMLWSVVERWHKREKDRVTRWLQVETSQLFFKNAVFFKVAAMIVWMIVKIQYGGALNEKYWASFSSVTITVLPLIISAL